MLQELSSFYPKIGTKPSKIRVWDLGSENRDPEKINSGSRIQGFKRHRSQIRKFLGYQLWIH
jgi:hypothetical protein